MTASNPEHRHDKPPRPPKIQSDPNAGAEAAAQAELAQAEQMADAALTAAASQSSAAPSTDTTSGSTSYLPSEARRTHHSMGELVNSAESLEPDSDSHHHTIDDIF